MLSKQRLPINHTKLIKIKTFLIGYKIKNINMKKSYIIFSLVLFISSCVTTNQVFFSDPNYLNSDEFSSAETINEAYKKTYSENTLENQDTILENDQYDAYDNDYYYNFSYSSRIRRFHRPMMLNYGFYSGYYTDYYWYNPDPFYWGSSIYYGYGWNLHIITHLTTVIIHHTIAFIHLFISIIIHIGIIMVIMDIMDIIIIITTTIVTMD